VGDKRVPLVKGRRGEEKKKKKSTSVTMSHIENRVVLLRTGFTAGYRENPIFDSRHRRERRSIP